jgi:hypothetical protein
MQMKRNGYLITVFVGLALALGVVGGARAQSGGPSPQEGVGVQAVLGTGFTYQGQLKSSGSPVNGSCTFGFGLWDASSGGVQLGVTQTVTTTVTNGLFTVTLNDSEQFGSSAFSGSNARYLGIGVKCGSESTLMSLGRQALTAAPYALYARNNWGLNGNSGTSVSNFLGTTNNMTLTLAVSNTAALRLVPNATSPTIIGGWSGNRVSVGIFGATIGGGGASGFTNTVSANYGTVSGGGGNIAGSQAATVGGGLSNTTNGFYATIAGGTGNSTNGQATTIGGGNNNTASNQYATVGGGNDNTASGLGALVAGGNHNTASGLNALVAGGDSNTASGSDAAVGGGTGNTASGTNAVVSGGFINTASGYAATVPGGQSNLAQGTASFAAGYDAAALHNGAFVWADAIGTPISSTVANQFVVRASNGVSLTVDAGGSKAIDVGEHYRDNAIVAWGKVSSAGAISADFGVITVTHNATGNYSITLEATAASAAQLIPVANVEVEAMPLNATNARFIYINQQTATKFDVYITNGNYIEIDNDFTFIVTAR